MYTEQYYRFDAYTGWRPTDELYRSTKVVERVSRTLR